MAERTVPYVTEINFSDAAAEDWYYVEIQKAVEAGYIVGDNDDTVRPADEITRQEVAVVITRLNELEQNDDVSMFADKDEIAEWVVGYVGAVAEAEYMIGDDKGNFNPADNITRAEALVTLDRSMTYWVEYAFINELSIEGAELDQSFEPETTTYSAVAADGATEVTIEAYVTADTEISFTTDLADSEIEVTTASAIEGGVIYTAKAALSDSEDTVITITASQEGLEDEIYTITIKKEAVEEVNEDQITGDVNGEEDVVLENVASENVTEEAAQDVTAEITEEVSEEATE